MTNKHSQHVAHRYTVNYPEHEPRESDPHYVDFHHWRNAHIGTARCAFGVARGGDFSECHPGPDSWPHGLECHHSVLEYAVQNSVDLALLERDYPGVSDPDSLGAWVESGDNLVFYCTMHHRGPGGVHNASASDWVAEQYVRGLIS